MKIILTLVMILLTGQLATQAHQQVRTESEKIVVRDSVVIRNILNAVSTHVLSVTNDRRRPLVVKDGKKFRRFIVMKFPGEVSQNKNIYTAQIDCDEFDHKIPRILYADLKASKGIYKVIRIRIGPNHFRDGETPH